MNAIIFNNEYYGVFSSEYALVLFFYNSTINDRLWEKLFILIAKPINA